MSDKINHNAFRTLFSLRAVLLVFLLCIGIVSCKKELSDADNLQSKLGSGMVSYVQGSNVVALNGINYNFTPYYVGVPIQLKEAAKSADTVTATVDPSLVAQYNQIYLENNPSISEGVFQVSHQGTFPLAAGATQAKDSLYVVLNDGGQLKDSTVYLVPVTLSAKSGSKLTYSIFFFKVLVTKGDLQAKMEGATVASGTSVSRLSSGALQVIPPGTLPDSLKFRLTLNKVFPAHDVSIQATLLTQSEISEGITKERFVGIPVPDNTGALTKDLVSVAAGVLSSRDSLTLRFPNKSALTNSQWYVMGVKIITYTGSQYGVPPVANDSCRAYVRFFFSK